MPRTAQRIGRPWLAEMVDKLPGGRKGTAEKLRITVGLLNEYITARRTPRPARAILIGQMVGFDWQRFYDDAAS